MRNVALLTFFALLTNLVLYFCHETAGLHNYLTSFSFFFAKDKINDFHLLYILF
jgi:hypothetical protein